MMKEYENRRTPPMTDILTRAKDALKVKLVYELCGHSKDNHPFCHPFRSKILSGLNKPDTAEQIVRDLMAEVKMLREALEPFSEMAGEMFAQNWNDDGVAISLVTRSGRMTLTFKEFRASRAALEGDKP